MHLRSVLLRKPACFSNNADGVPNLPKVLAQGVQGNASHCQIATYEIRMFLQDFAFRRQRLGRDRIRASQ